MMKKLLLFTLAITLFWMLSVDAFAAIQLNDTLRPSNLPDPIEIEDALTDANPETAATQTVILFVGRLMSRVLVYAGVVAVAFLVVAGANYILAFGKDERIEKGKRGIFWAVMGLIVIMFSYALVQAVISIILKVDVSVT